jgi:hypothetical protein
VTKKTEQLPTFEDGGTTLLLYCASFAALVMFDFPSGTPRAALRRDEVVDVSAIGTIE